MNAEFFEAIEDIEKEKGIPRSYMYDKINQAILTARTMLKSFLTRTRSA